MVVFVYMLNFFFLQQRKERFGGGAGGEMRESKE